MKNKEIYKEVEGFPGYWVSNFGIVYTALGRKIKPLIPSPNGIGYMQVNLYKDCKKHKKYVHRLVADAFIPNPDSLPEINHMDHDKTNNAVDNLEWISREENNRYSHCKPVIDLTTGAIYQSAVAVSKALNVSDSTIGTHIKYCEGKYKGHKFMFLKPATEESVNTIEIFRKKYEIPEIFTEERFVDLFGDWLN